jgi:PAS domain S-box-containing protein
VTGETRAQEESAKPIHEFQEDRQRPRSRLSIPPGMKRTKARSEKTAENTLLKGERMFRELFENVPAIAFVMERGGKLVTTNQVRSQTLRGSDRTATAGTLAIPRATRELWRQVGHQVIGSGHPAWYTEVVLMGYGEKRYFETRVNPIKQHGAATGVIGVVNDVTESRGASEELRKREEEVLRQSRNLEETNAALRVVLEKREGDKRELGERIMANVKELVVPYLERLQRGHLDSQQRALISIALANMREILSPFAATLSSRFLNLTPTQIKVAALIRDGRTTKEIASLLHLSENTIVSHRFHIRSKLGLRNRTVNLRSYLRSLQGEDASFSISQ